MPKKISQELEAKIVQFAKDGLTVVKMVELTGLSRSTIDNYIKWHNLRYVPITPEVEKRMLELRASGMALTAIAKELGIARNTIHRYVKEHNIDLGPSVLKIITEEVAAKILELHNTGMLAEDIAAQVGAKPLTIVKFYKKRGLTRNYKQTFTQIDPITANTIIKMTVEDGYGAPTISKAVNLSEHVIHSFWKRNNIQSRHPSYVRNVFETEEEEDRYRLKKKMRHSSSSTVLGRFRKRLNTDKGGDSLVDGLDYTMDDLLDSFIAQFSLPENLTPDGKVWMTLKNYGRYSSKTRVEGDYSTYTWQIDHRIPQIAFDYTSVHDPEFKKCWALSNLRPMESKQNMSEGARGYKNNKPKQKKPT